MAQEWTASTSAPLAVATDAVLYQLATALPLSDRLTLELFGRGLTDSAGEAIQGGALELRYSLTDTLALGIGYSTVGTADPDLQLVAPWTEGVFVRVTETF
ncbi:MAG TPA: hypothetical protein VIK98_08895 [Limnochordales bacterium]